MPSTDIKMADVNPGKSHHKSCKMCLKVTVCQAYALARATNDQFASIDFIELKKPVIESPESLAEHCKEYCPPDSELFQPVTLAEKADLA